MISWSTVSFFLFSSFWLNMYDTLYSTVFYFLQWKGTFWSTNQSLHIRVTINYVFVSAFLIDNTNCFNFLLFSLNVAHKKLVFFSFSPNALGLWFSFFVCFWQLCSGCFIFLILFALAFSHFPSCFALLILFAVF